MIRILQARLQQYVNRELPVFQARFGKGGETRNLIANICWIIEKARKFLKNIYFCFIDYAKAFDCVDHIKLWKILKEMGMPDYLICLLREAEDIKKRWQEYTEELYKKDLHDPDNHDGMITHLELDVLECEVKWALGSITTNKASGGDGIPVELFQILKDDAVKVLNSICQQIFRTQQWPQDWKRSVSFQSQRKAMPKSTQTITQLHSSHMLVRRRQWHPTPVLLPGKSDGQRSLIGCSPWGR